MQLVRLRCRPPKLGRLRFHAGEPNLLDKSLKKEEDPMRYGERKHHSQLCSRVVVLAALLCLAQLLIWPQSGSSVTIYVTATGKKYHLQGCGSLRKSSIPMKLGDAVAAGYAPCSRCGPPTLSQPKGSSDSPSAASASAASPHNTPARQRSTPQQPQATAPAGTPTGQTTATGLPIYEGPRGGHYHYSKSGKKVYERKK